MNNNKATYEEGFLVDLFKHDLCALVSHQEDLFNHVACIGFPLAWSHHIIPVIHKSGPSVNPNNYRTIMVGHTFLKLYVTTLHMKFSCEIENRHLRSRGQTRFHPGHQTIDQIFTLWAIIEEARHRSSKVYCCFVDFWKDFDSIPREALFWRLRDIGIYHTLLTAIMCLYESVHSCLHTEFIGC